MTLPRPEAFRPLALFAALLLFVHAAASTARAAHPDRLALLGLPETEHASAADSLRKAGYRPVSVDAYGSEASPSFASSWIRAAGPAWSMVHGLSAEALRDSLPAWASRGLAPARITGTGSTPSFAAVLEKDTADGPPRWIRPGQDRDAFRRTADSAQRAGYRPEWIDAYGSRRDPLFVSIWSENSGGAPWNYSLGDDAESLREKAATFAPVWVRPALVVPLPDGSLLTVWNESSIGPWSLNPALPAEGAEAALRTEAARGMHPLVLSGPPADGASRRAAAGPFTVLAAGLAAPLPRLWTVTGPGASDASGGDFGAFDEYMRRLMSRHQVRAGALAMVKDGRLVLARGYTWAEAGYPVTHPNSLFRVASCSKPLTSMAIHRLLREGGEAAGPLSLKEKALALLSPQAGGEPADKRFAEITVDDLLSHSAGWIRSKENPDPVFNDYPAGSPIRRRLPETAKDFLAYMLGQPLQFEPGSRNSYVNFGYFLLGRILERLPHGLGRSYEQAVADLIFKPLGLSRPRFGETLVEGRQPGEVLYHTRYPYLQRSREKGKGPWVPGAYGDFDLRNMDAAGAWIMAATDYAKVLASFDLEAANPVLAPEAVRTMWAPPHDERFLRGWFASRVRSTARGETLTAKWHNGLFPGTSTLVYYRPDKWSFALFLNRDITPHLSGDLHGRELGRLADKVTAWPKEDLFPAVGIASFGYRGKVEGAAAPAEAGNRAHYTTADR
jgi:CubicO group peptidase (beta-lactamase class C family)